ncbi:hypothetical protein CROQUDRAFT_662450 [Cronartium quercuum f. sp. fusiforme G11]|uniref:dynamin GTPase n=1 Tax=Cronartium quercuum f. sp. fusiforme G11 TaxID=708437 RepID=A0A9P6N9J8_9BASI|nr:hypothetical protein CROQUDRAFT_662450 [Cronartium quercuum f. sp. fusiforme G11]
MSLRRWNAISPHRRQRSTSYSDHSHSRGLHHGQFIPHFSPPRSIGVYSGLMLPHLVSQRLLSTGSLGFTRSSAFQVRQMSFISAAARAAGKVGGRLFGIGALGVGSAAYVGSQVDVFKSNVFGAISGTYHNLANALEDLATSAGRTVSNISQGASEVLTTTTETFEDSLQSILHNLNNFWTDFNSGEDGGQQDSNGPGKEHRPEFDPSTTFLPAAALAYGLTDTDSDPVEGSTAPTKDSSAGLMQLTRKLIEIRSLLMSIDQDDTLILPSIVVIGSQSSGKTSVLEAIVGHEFLPKGHNMVTRRPLELTLIHTPPTTGNPSPKEYLESPEFGPGRFHDFLEVQRRLTRLNQDVPDSVAVDDQPIHLKVYSPHVPDLTLVDLPGYVQVSSMDQPEELREKISQLCERYIRKPNLILAVCAADVDLANSPALRASKKVDPHGYRTIGVVTKLDLVEPTVGASILSNDRYRLALGYVGVICKPPKTSLSGSGMQLMRQGGAGSAQAVLAEHEHAYFRNHAEAYNEPNLMLGTTTLKQRLMKVLEESMSSSLHDISNRVSLELEEASYQYKVQYNDRNISAETYVAETMDLLKRQLAEFSKMLVKPEVRSMLKRELDQKVLGLLAEVYWSDRRAPELGKLGESRLGPEGLDPYWIHRLEAAQSRLTKGGIGRTSADLVADEIRFAVTKILQHEPMTYHPKAVSEMVAITEDILDGLRARAADHVEIAVMPYRYEVDVERSEWENGRTRAVKLMEEEISLCDNFLRAEKIELRKNWRLREALEHVREDEERLRRRAQRWLLEGGVSGPEAIQDEPEETRPPPILLDRARRLRDMEARSEILRLRYTALKSRRCKSGPASQPFCPEVFLNVLADRLSGTATDFINIDLLSRFFSALPHELNSRLIKPLEGSEALEFARENPEIRRHLELQDRKEKLEKVMRELVALAYMQQDNDESGGHHHRLVTSTNHRRRSTGYFSSFF